MKIIQTLLLFVFVSLTALHAGPIRVLLITGQNNHKWKETTPVIKAFLEKAGDIEVTVNTQPEKLGEGDFKRIDVIFSNWNTYDGRSKVKEWPESTRKAYTDFVRNGGGHVGVHAGTSSFPDWEDYRHIGMVWWELNQTRHGRQHAFKVRLENPEHPVTKGWAPRPITDELWRNVGVHPKATVLVSSYSAKHDGGKETWEPSVFVGQFGKGRCFSTTLGHDAKLLKQTDVQEMIIRGVQWTGKKR